MKAIIPTGGRGTRMRPLTFSYNKHFIPVAGKPLIFYPVEAIVAAGIKEIAITYNPGGLEQAQATLGDGSQFGVSFTYVLQDSPTGGLANIVEVCEEFIGDDKFIFHLGDNIFVDGIQELMEKFENSEANALVTMIQHKDNSRLGVPFFDEEGKFVKYVEKPENPPNNFGIPGLYFFDANVYKAFKGENRIKPSERGELEVGSLYNWLMENGFSVDTMEYTGKWLDPGKFDDWLEANRYILDNKLEASVDPSAQIDDSSQIADNVTIGVNCKIENSQIEGPSIIGDNCEIKGSKIGAYSALSDDCQINNGQVQNSVLMRGVKVTNVTNTIDNSLIGPESEISHHEDNSLMKLFVGEKCVIEV